MEKQSSLQKNLLKGNPGTGIGRRDFIKSAVSATAVTFAGTNVLYAESSNNASQGQTKKRPWIDCHIHVSDIGGDGKKRVNMLEDLLDVLDRCDADLRFVISPDASYMSRILKDPAGMMEASQMIHNLCLRAPGRLYGSCMVNPNFLDEALRVMNICFQEWGFVQLGEMLGYMHKYNMKDYATAKCVQLAARYDVPVQVHIGTYTGKGSVPGGSGDGMNQLCDLIAVAERVPEAKYILAHAIGCGPTPKYISWANMILDALKGLYTEFPENFWVEIRDFQAPAVPRAILEVPVNRLLSGTDWTTRIGPPFQPYGTMFDVKETDNPFPPKVSSFVDFLLKAGATDADITLIGYENARKLYKLP